MDEQSVEQPKRPRRRRRIAVVLLGLIVATLVVVFQGEAMSLSQGDIEEFLSSLRANFSDASSEADDDALEASGVIQVEEVSVASEFGGRIVALPAAEGRPVP